eukprot:CAMPEP_0119022744 /NCGR_PEP_ID=MMETSP1176-20130426/28679_1 /TAXON_ID=265551 /ORGANISM="Synedropsis recta cf, Strain CCMP1620" /LENGTH=287 /DNA_ID=CAMNT_0006977679 /DNA_START=14 /DNA_END=873 /DNA_ORIENTATION=-
MIDVVDGLKAMIDDMMTMTAMTIVLLVDGVGAQAEVDEENGAIDPEVTKSSQENRLEVTQRISRVQNQFEADPLPLSSPKKERHDQEPKESKRREPDIPPLPKSENPDTEGQTDLKGDERRSSRRSSEKDIAARGSSDRSSREGRRHRSPSDERRRARSKSRSRERRGRRDRDRSNERDRSRRRHDDKKRRTDDDREKKKSRDSHHRGRSPSSSVDRVRSGKDAGTSSSRRSRSRRKSEKRRRHGRSQSEGDGGGTHHDKKKRQSSRRRKRGSDSSRKDKAHASEAP